MSEDFGCCRKFLIPLVFLTKASTSKFLICSPMKWWYPYRNDVGHVLSNPIVDIEVGMYIVYTLSICSYKKEVWGFPMGRCDV